MKPMPTISVVMPVYNGELYLAEAIESILNQTFTDFEFIIVDNGSTDRTPQILEQYAGQDERITIHLEPQTGVATALNAGCKLASGKYIARMDADDISMLERFAIQVAFLEADPDIGVVGTWMHLVNSAGEKFGSWETAVEPALVKWQVFFGCPFAHPTVMMKLESLRELGYYSTAYLAEDYELWSRLLATSKGANIPRFLVNYRQHGEQFTSRLATKLPPIALEIGTKAMASYIGENVDPAIAHSLRHPANAVANIASVAILAETLLHSFVNREQLTKEQTTFVQNDIASRLFSMAIRRPHKLSSWSVIWKAARLDPEVLMRKVRIRLA